MFPVSDVIPSRRKPFVTIGLIAVNTLVFLFQLQLGRTELFAFAREFGATPADFFWPRALTGAFLHDGWIQFGANMVCLWIFGDNVEDSMGHGAYGLFYLACALLAACAHAAVNPSSMLPLAGASAAVAAIIGAYFVLYPGSRVLMLVFLVVYRDVVEVPAMFFVALWLVLQLLSSVASAGAGAPAILAIDSHLTGFAAGAASGLLLRRRSRSWD